jgi:hypothetical protein
VTLDVNARFGCARVLRDVRECLSDDVVGRHLDGFGKTTGRNSSDLDRDRGSSGQGRERHVESAISGDRGMEPTRQLPQLRTRKSELLTCLVERTPRAIGILVKGGARET